MIVVAVALAGAVVGFHLATRSRNPFPARGSAVALWLLGFLWYLGTLAIYPSFVAGGDRYPYLGFPVFVIILSALMMLAATMLWVGIFKILTLAAQKYTRVMANY